jgi:hypothetical protein
MSEDEGFLQRWSRRKQDALREEIEAETDPLEQPDVRDPAEANDRSQAEEADAVLVEASEDASDAASDPDADEPEPPGDEDMPPLESIDQGGSIKPFMSPRVSEGLRRAALRRLFRQPKYNVVDMLDDYAEDYSKPVALGNIVTADMRYRAEQAAKRMARIYKESTSEQESAVAASEEPLDSGAEIEEAIADGQPGEGTEAQVAEPGELADAEEETPADDEDVTQGADRQRG